MTPLLVTGVIRGAFVLAVVLILLPLLRRKMPASLQHLVLLLALVSQIAIPALTVFGPSRTDAIVPSGGVGRGLVSRRLLIHM